MTIVVDLGCADYGSQDSVRSLIDKYHPDRLYAFDPHPIVEEGRWMRKGVSVVFCRRAAWLHDGDVGYHENITSSHIVSDDTDTVPCFDFSKWLAGLGEHVILKMDVEGAEYDLLERMIADGTDHLVDELIIEWHDDDRGLIERLACPVKDWWM